jgi:predicted kinase
VFYHRYAGHEPISGNEFMSFMCDHVELRNLFFAQGYGWEDVRKIKFMIEHHLPYGLKKEAKRSYLRQAIGCTMGEDDNCYWDMLRSDARGRISDDHETKLDNVEEWIHEFRPLPWEPAVADPLQKTLYLLVGVSGSGKSSWLKKLIEHLPHRFLVFNEDALRLEYAHDNLDSLDQEIWPQLTLAEQYDSAWKFCHPHADSKFDTFSSEKFRRLLDTDRSIVVDCMNQGRKDRRRFIQRAKQAGYVIRSVEFFISESTAKARQQERGDKFLPPERVHLLFMQMEIPWLGSEIDGFEIIPPN